MALLRNLIVFIFTVTLITFIAFFGRLPAFRNTPISYLHRLLVLHIPTALRKCDLKLTNGRITDSGSRLGHYLVYDKHPLVIIFFLGLVSGCAVLFVPAVWPFLKPHHKFGIVVLLPQPYGFVYLCAKSNSQTCINTKTHAEQMRNYPYDRVLFYPGNKCSTCDFMKPARSKHCSICKTCVARMDHHCIWVNNCLGRGNYKYFLALLASTTIMVAYAAYLAYLVLSPQAQAYYNAYEKWYVYRPAPDSDPSSWATYFDEKGHYLLAYISIYLDVGGLGGSGVGLLALLTWPLPLGLLIYHFYLIWAGMTTNESSKWADWRDDMREGVVFLGHRRKDTIDSPPSSPADGESTQISASNMSASREDDEPLTSWPLESRHILVRTRDGQPPKTLPARIAAVATHDGFERVWSLAAVENVYDLGVWDNIAEVLLH